MKIGVTGCSNSSSNYGKPWHEYVKQEYNSEIISSSTSGGANEVNLDKIKYILDNNQLDYFIVQITDPSRFIVGIEYDVTKPQHDDFARNTLNNGGSGASNFNLSSYYSFNVHENQKYINDLLDENFTDIDKFILNYVYISNYNVNIKIFHTLLAMKQLCEIYNVKVLFFSWFVDLIKLAKKSNYTKIIESLDICDDYVTNYAKVNKILPIPHDSHFDSLGHKKIFDGYLKPFLDKHIKTK